MLEAKLVEIVYHAFRGFNHQQIIELMLTDLEFSG